MKSPQGLRTFKDRRDAGKAVLEKLKELSLEKPIVYALPRGGVEIGKIVSEGLSGDFDIVLAAKLGAPFQQELAIGAIVEGSPPYVYRNEEMMKVLRIQSDYFENEVRVRTKDLEAKKKLYRRGQARKSAKDRHIILVDDGVATGATVKAALHSLRADQPKSMCLAIPVCPPDVVEELKADADQIICVQTPSDFKAVGQYYRLFDQLTEQDVASVVHSLL